MPFTQFLRLRRLCGDDSDFSTPNRSIDSQHYKRLKGNTDRIPSTLKFHPHNHAVKTIILKKSFSFL